MPGFPTDPTPFLRELIRRFEPTREGKVQGSLPGVLDGANASGTVGVMAAGAVLIGLALPRGPVVHRYAGCDRMLAW